MVLRLCIFVCHWRPGSCGPFHRVITRLGSLGDSGMQTMCNWSVCECDQMSGRSNNGRLQLLYKMFECARYGIRCFLCVRSPFDGSGLPADHSARKLSELAELQPRSVLLFCAQGSPRLKLWTRDWVYMLRLPFELSFSVYIIVLPWSVLQ